MHYVLIVIVTAICIYNVRSESSKLGENQKVKNISDMFTWYEVSMLLVTGIILFGLGAIPAIISIFIYA